MGLAEPAKHPRRGRAQIPEGARPRDEHEPLRVYWPTKRRLGIGTGTRGGKKAVARCRTRGDPGSLSSPYGADEESEARDRSRLHYLFRGDHATLPAGLPACLLRPMPPALAKVPEIMPDLQNWAAHRFQVRDQLKSSEAFSSPNSPEIIGWGEEATDESDQTAD